VPLERGAQLNKLFTASAKYFQDVDNLCDIDDCHQMVASARHHLADGQYGLQNGTMAHSDWQAWFSENELRLEGVQMALASVMQRQHFQSNVSELQYEKRRPACKMDANFDPARCDRVFAEATAICTIGYGAIPAAFAICEGAAIYGYNNCLAAAEQP
jgi:hypothetical protein